MNARFSPSARNNDNSANLPLDDAIPARDATADLAGRACCCPAKPMLRVLMPPTAARAHETELLLCGHHYRASRQVLAAARARVRELPGTPGDAAAWIRLESHTAAAQVGQ